MSERDTDTGEVLTHAKGRCLEAETAWANQSTEKPGTLPKKPVSQREDAITQKRLSQIVPASAVMDEAVLDPVLQPGLCCPTAGISLPALCQCWGMPGRQGSQGAGQTSCPHPPRTSKQC